MEFLPSLIRILQVVLGVGLVIFVHELGHFLAARWCGVRVDVFSIGMGPKLFGWKPGDTDYQIAALPIGGYVRWAGEEWRPEDGPAPTDHFASKTVGQRFFMYSGGVIMNVLFGLVVFPILFWQGLEFVKPAAGTVLPGGPAWSAGMPEGAEVLQINGEKIYEFGHIVTAVALGDPDLTTVQYRDPSTGAERTVDIEPVRGGFANIPQIGIGSPMLRDADGRPLVEVEVDSPAWDAGLRSGDSLVAFVDPLAGVPVEDEYTERLLDGRSLALRVDGPDGPREVEFRAEQQPLGANAGLVVGIRPPLRTVAGVRAPETLPVDLRVGDRLVSVNGRRILGLGDLAAALPAAGESVAIAIERPVGSAASSEEEAAEDAEPPTFVAEVLSVPALSAEARAALLANVALEGDMYTGVVQIQGAKPAYAAGLRSGDELLSIEGAPVGHWSEITAAIQASATAESALTVQVARLDASGSPTDLAFEVQPRPASGSFTGITFLQDEYLFRTDGLLPSLQVGAVFSWRFLQDTWMTLKRMILGSVSPRDALGGPVSIATISYKVAEQGLAKLFFFLCILSINLAFINVLPIPVLDGGHLFFLIVEKIKGSPVSERIMGYSQMVGVVLILSLMVYVTYNDLVRHVF